MGTCHQCAALAEELAQARAELEAAKAELAKQALRYTTDPAFGMECVVNAERYAALNSQDELYYRRHVEANADVHKPGEQAIIRLRDLDGDDCSSLDALADALIAAATTAPTVETAPEVTP